jgi:NAD(P)-dependent dehydrogenase (short-subunit alcohol dehydrogenase family)
MDLLGATPNDFIVLAETIQDKLGKLDGLIHTAAEFSGLTEFVHYEATRWLKEMQINVNSPIFLTQALMPLLQHSKGQIIFTLEDLEVTCKAYWGAYGVGKSAIAHFAKTLEQEMQSSQVQVHCITPAPMKTQLRAKAWSGEDDSHLIQPEQVVKEYLKILA